MRKIVPGTAVVIVACLAAVVTMGILGRDTSQIMIVVMTVLGGVIYGKVDALQQQTNGNQSAMLQLVARQSEQLAATMPPPTPPPPPPPAREEPS